VNQSAYKLAIPDLIGPDRLDRASEFVSCWLYQNLPRFYISISVVEVAARLKRDAVKEGIDLGAFERSSPLAIERLVLQAMDARVSKQR
jgi:hypothetical protein